MTLLATYLRFLAACEERHTLAPHSPHTWEYLGKTYETIIGYNPFVEDDTISAADVLNILREHMATALMAASMGGDA